MGDVTRISWANKTWNPWMGCRHVSPECDHCYAESMVNRLRDSPEQKAKDYDGPHAFDIVTRTKTWSDPRRWQREAEKENRFDLVFTCSLSDFFIQDADQWRPDIWKIIRDTPNLIYQILTKRPELIERRLPDDWGRNGYPNCWLGVSVGTRKFLKRMDVLRRIPAHVRFVSAEPLLEDICPDLESCILGFDQVIVGGESGNNSDLFRFMDHKWARNILNVCEEYNVAFWFKQSSARKTEMGIELEGRGKIQQYPRQYYQYKSSSKLF
jgi:protein gp37